MGFIPYTRAGGGGLVTTDDGKPLVLPNIKGPAGGPNGELPTAANLIYKTVPTGPGQPPRLSWGVDAIASPAPILGPWEVMFSNLHVESDPVDGTISHGTFVDWYDYGSTPSPGGAAGPAPILLNHDGTDPSGLDRFVQIRDAGWYHVEAYFDVTFPEGAAPQQVRCEVMANTSGWAAVEAHVVDKLDYQHPTGPGVNVTVPASTMPLYLEDGYGFYCRITWRNVIAPTPTVTKCWLNLLKLQVI